MVPVLDLKLANFDQQIPTAASHAGGRTTWDNVAT